VTEEFPRAERAYRRAIRRHDFDKNHLKVLDFVLFHSYGRPDGRARAWLPRQDCLKSCMGIDAGNLSKVLKWLESNRVIDKVVDDDGVWLAMMDPNSWRVPLNVEDERVAVDMDDWLERARPGHPELFPPPPSLNDALREVFVEAQSRGSRPMQGQEQGRESRVEAASSRNGSESVQDAGHYGPAGRVVELPSKHGVERPAIGNLPTAADREDRDRGSVPRSSLNRGTESPSRETSTRSREEALRSETRRPASIETRAYADSRLFGLIGEHERRAACGQLFERAIAAKPDDVIELVSHVEDLRRTGQLTSSVGAYMNKSVYRLMNPAAKGL
jgi:hypothetical protein